MDDWDLLFRAALEFLSRAALEAPPSAASRAPLQAPGMALRECLDGLDLLRRTVPVCRPAGTDASQSPLADPTQAQGRKPPAAAALPEPRRRLLPRSLAAWWLS